MAESLFISEGHVVDSSGTRIATLTDLAEEVRITALENRIAELENAQRPPTPSPPMPGTVVGGEQVMEPVHTGSTAPPGSSQTIHFLPPEEQAGAPVPAAESPAESPVEPELFDEEGGVQ